MAAAWPGVALAQPAVADPGLPPGSLRAAALPDGALQALIGSAVTIQAVDGNSLTGRVLGFDAQTLTVALADTGDVLTLPRNAITRVRLVEPPRPAGVQASPPVDQERPAAPPATARLSPPGEDRHFGLHFAAAPSLMLDVDYGRFYGFANFDLVFPLATAGNSRTWLAGSIGGGVSFRVSPSSGWKFDVFALVSPATLGGSDQMVGFGVGIGMHYTFNSGFCFAFKLPAIGYAVDPSSISSLDSDEAVGMFYLSAAMGLPLVSVGYRF